jgi:predicted PurR-regulated permease PerM
LTRVVLSVGAIGTLIATTLWIVLPFATAFLWASVIVISTWPLLLALQARLWGKRGMAAAVLTLALLLMLLLPLGFSVGALVGNIDRIATWVGSLDTFVMPAPPSWLGSIPVVGGKIAERWQNLAAEGPGSATSHALPYARGFIRWFATQVGGAGAMVLQFLMTVIICAVLYMKGESAGRGVRLFFTRLAGPSGDRVVLLAANSIRGVAVGIAVTAVVQVLIAGTGLWVTSVPGVWLLCAALLFLCLAQLGPAPIMIPAVIWQFYRGATLSGFTLLVFAIVALTIDNFLRPVLIRKGADLPLLLIFTGVIGGMISMGIMGIFLGPVILAVTFDLLKAWVENRPEVDEGSEIVERTTAAAIR